MYALSLALIFLLTLLPDGSDNELRLVPFSDFHRTTHHPFHVIGLVGNVLLFVPFGVALWFGGVRFRRAVAVGAALSIAIEAAQLAIPGRWTSTDDVILNTLGTAVGYLAAVGLRQ
jgi:glycopeptide antibiotics resistance protein